LDRPVVLALDFGGTKIAAAVADVDGRRLAEATVPTARDHGADWNFERGLEAARELVSADGTEVAVVCASTFGIPASSGVGLAPAIDGWESLAIGDELERAFPESDVHLVTDVKAAASAEAAHGALHGHDPAIYLNLGTGLAVGIVCGGTVVAGANGAAGEIGYSLRAGRPGMLEDAVSGIALAAEGGRIVGGEITAADVFASEDPRLVALVEDFVDELTFHLANLTIALDPARIAVGGGMVRSWDRLEGPLRRGLEAGVPFPPELVVGRFPFDAALVGALNIAVEAASNIIIDNRSRRDRRRSRA
jgi:glucokinase